MRVRTGQVIRWSVAIHKKVAERSAAFLGDNRRQPTAATLDPGSSPG